MRGILDAYTLDGRAFVLYTRFIGTYDARAMKTRPDERLPYLDLARQGARVVRRVPADAFSRLGEIAPGRGELCLEMVFSLDQERRPWVSGTVSVPVDATCQRCLEHFERVLEAEFSLCIVSDEQLASDLAEDVDVLVAETGAVTVADVVEDELILAVPDRLCTAEPCPYAPPLDYPADGAEPPARDNPFSVLSDLKR